MGQRLTIRKRVDTPWGIGTIIGKEEFRTAKRFIVKLDNGKKAGIGDPAFFEDDLKIIKQ